MSLEQEFLERYGNQSFPHAERVLACLREGGCKVRSTSEGNLLPCSHYARIARARAEYGAKTGQIPQELYEDCVRLYESLELTPEEGCRLWIFGSSDGARYAVYEAVGSGRIAGCFQVYKDGSEAFGAI
ncbi:MAG: hypothetical protein M3362_01585 [Acidobacteriota bacterium]|nr:hypothetical protein [Acidobacteriota bacterium]